MPREENQQSYYPTARVRLILRFEDFGAADVPQPPVKPPHRLKGTKDKSVEQLQVVNEGGRLVLLGPGDDPSHVGSPQTQVSSSDRRTHVVDGILPLRAQLSRQGIRQGKTLNVELTFGDAPFDPRVIRSCAVEYYLGCITPEEYQRGLAGEVRGQSATPLSYLMCPDEYVDRYGRTRTNLRFQGWVDVWDADWPMTDSPTVRLTCTDNTRLVIDQDAPPKLTIDAGQPIDAAVADYLSNFPQFRGLAVEYRPSVDSSRVPVLKDSLARTKYQPNLGPTPSGSKLKVWDYITDVCGTIGHVCYFDGVTIVIQRARTLYNSSLPARPTDPFTGRILPSGRQLDRRTYIYGRNIEEMSVARKFTVNAPQNIEVRSYDTASKKTIVARFPVSGERQSSPKPGDASNQKWTVVRVTGIRSQTVLQLAAQSIYEQLGRNELGVRLVTKNLGSFGGDNLDPDALDLEPGDAVDVEVLREASGLNTTTDVQDAIRVRPAEFLRSLGYGDDLAKAYAAAVSQIGLPTTYRTKSVGLDWSNDDGVTIDLELVNFIEVRSDRDLPEGEEITSGDVQDSAAAGTGPVRVVVEGS